MASDSGVKGQALSQFGTNRGTAADSLNYVSPIYQRLASGTQGYTPTQLANQRTAVMQSEGGAEAGAAGRATLDAARTGNVGGSDAALAEIARTGGVDATNAELGVQNQDADIARQNQRIGLGGLSNIYDTANSQANANLGAANQAAKPFWQQLLMGGLSAGASAYDTYATTH